MNRYTFEEMRLRAKTKKDGQFSCYGIPYTVKDGRPHMYIEGNIIYEILGAFVVAISGEFPYLHKAVLEMNRMRKKK